MNARDVAQRISNGKSVRRSGAGWMVPCPAHDDDTPSLSIAPGANTAVVLHCHAGCDVNDVLAAADLAWDDLNDEQPALEAEIVYPYTDEEWRLLAQVVRQPGKKFLQRRPGEIPGTWIWNLRGVRRVLYRLPHVIEAVAEGKPVWITEGEKDAEYVTAAGVCGTTHMGGAGKWRDEYAEVLEDADVTIWADKDEAGWKHAHQVRQSLLDHNVGSVRIVESGHGKDAADHLSHGLGLDDVLVTVPAVIDEAPALFLRVDEFIDQEREIKPWALEGLMRRGGERLILTGYEGYGKSSMLKQIAVGAAVGMHPFTLCRMGEPQRVLFIDCENPKEDLQEDFSRLREVARTEGKWDDPDLFVQANPPLNLCDLPDAVWLAERVRAHRPNLLVIGPLYNLLDSDSSNEVEVRRMLRVIGRVQTEVDCAVIIEHHAPHSMVGDERSLRPFGSSVLMRWPSFGFGLRPTNKETPMKHPFEFHPWRGVRRRGRSWPAYVRQIGSERAGWYWKDVTEEIRSSY